MGSSTRSGRRRAAVVIVLLAVGTAALGAGRGAAPASASAGRPVVISCADDGGRAYISYDAGGAPLMNRCPHSVLFGVTVAPPSTSMLDQVAGELGSATAPAALNTASTYVPWGSCAAASTQCALNLFSPGTAYNMAQIAAAGATPVLSWEPWNSQCQTAACEAWYSDAAIAAGHFDGSDDPNNLSGIKGFAFQVAQWHQPVFIRLADEMNGYWAPWGTQGTAACDFEQGRCPNEFGITNQPSSFVAMWDHVRSIFAAEGATNVTWIWNPNVGASDGITADYPGNAEVDVVGLDGYNYAAREGVPWRSAASVLQPSLDVLRDLAPTKPEWIGETATSEPAPVETAAGEGKAGWITHLGTDLLNGSWSHVVGFSYYDIAGNDFMPFDCGTNGTVGGVDYRCDGSPGRAPPDPGALASMRSLVATLQQ